MDLMLKEFIAFYRAYLDDLVITSDQLVSSRHNPPCGLHGVRSRQRGQRWPFDFNSDGDIRPDRIPFRSYVRPVYCGIRHIKDMLFSVKSRGLSTVYGIPTDTISFTFMKIDDESQVSVSENCPFDRRLS